MHVDFYKILVDANRDFKKFQLDICRIDMPVAEKISSINKLISIVSDPLLTFELRRFVKTLNYALEFSTSKLKYFGSSHQDWMEVSERISILNDYFFRECIDDTSVDDIKSFNFSNFYHCDNEMVRQKYLHGLQDKVEARYLYSSKSSCVRFGHNGGGVVPVFFNDEKPFICSLFLDVNNPMLYSLDSVYVKRQPTYYRKKCIYMGVNGGDNYFFTLTNVLSLINQNLDDYYFCFPGYISSKYADLLSLIGVDGSKVLNSTSVLEYEFEQFFSITIPNSWNLNFAKEVRNFFHSPEYGSDRIYISRSDSSLRRLDNAKSIEAYFVKMGFKIHVLSELPTREQISIFSKAKYIAGEHGAGFSNIIFAPSGASVVEIFPPDYFNPAFLFRAINCGHKYVAYVESNFDLEHISKDESESCWNVNESNFQLFISKNLNLL